jgi:hypothetical protein
VEFFVKDKRTTDELVDKRLKLVAEFDANLKDYLSNMETFCLSSLCMPHTITSYLA